MLLEVSNLTKIYDKVVALDDFSLSLPQGKIVGLLGPNGCGKSTLIKILAGVLQPTVGTVKIDGLDIGLETKKIVSYLPDRSYFSGGITVTEAIETFADFYEDFSKERALELLNVLQIGVNRKLNTLSKGMREKVQLALVMSRNAKLYLLDEPIGGVDVTTRDFIIHYLFKNFNKEATVLISTHLIADIEDALDEFVLIKQGKTIAKGDVKKLKEETGDTLDNYVRGIFRCF